MQECMQWSYSLRILSHFDSRHTVLFIRWLQMINEYGFCLVENVPTEVGQIKVVWEQFDNSLWVYTSLFNYIFQLGKQVTHLQETIHPEVKLNTLFAINSRYICFFCWSSVIHPQVQDIVSGENELDVAYSSLRLDLHMDMMYYQSPPGIQILHCLRCTNYTPQLAICCISCGTCIQSSGYNVTL